VGGNMYIGLGEVLVLLTVFMVPMLVAVLVLRR
jgi:hypothetical protein